MAPAASRLASPSDAPVLGALLHDFNTEFGEPSPGAAVLARRLSGLLDTPSTLGLLAGDPAVGFALVTLRFNVWFDGPVALLDELYVVPALRNQGIGSGLMTVCVELLRARGVECLEINVDGEDVDARRFYERHGFRCTARGQTEPELYYSRELT